MSGEHPIHPAMVHFPIAFLTLSWGLDLLYFATSKLGIPMLVGRFSASMPDLTRASHYLLATGIITIIPAAVTGGQELMKMINNGGMYESDKKTIRPKIKAAIVHAAVNDLVLFGAIYSWYIRRSHDATGLLAPSDTNLLLNLILFPALGFAGNMGATLTYNFGVGINLAKKPKAK